jgi:hypothetical protein
VSLTYGDSLMVKQLPPKQSFGVQVLVTVLGDRNDLEGIDIRAMLLLSWKLIIVIC